MKIATNMHRSMNSCQDHRGLSHNVAEVILRVWTCSLYKCFFRDLQELNQWEKILQGKQKKNKFLSPFNVKDDALPINTRPQNEAAPGDFQGKSRSVLYITNEVNDSGGHLDTRLQYITLF